MRTISYSGARAHLAATMDEVISSHAPVIITRRGSPACVLVSLDDWESMDETNYIRSNPVNAQRLLESIREFESPAKGLSSVMPPNFSENREWYPGGSRAGPCTRCIPVQ